MGQNENDYTWIKEHGQPADVPWKHGALAQFIHPLGKSIVPATDASGSAPPSKPPSPPPQAGGATDDSDL
jgi:hypothetical protein